MHGYKWPINSTRIVLVDSSVGGPGVARHGQRPSALSRDAPARLALSTRLPSCPCLAAASRSRHGQLRRDGGHRQTNQALIISYARIVQATVSQFHPPADDSDAAAESGALLDDGSFAGGGIGGGKTSASCNALAQASHAWTPGSAGSTAPPAFCFLSFSRDGSVASDTPVLACSAAASASKAASSAWRLPGPPPVSLAVAPGTRSSSSASLPYSPPRPEQWGTGSRQVRHGEKTTDTRYVLLQLYRAAVGLLAEVIHTHQRRRVGCSPAYHPKRHLQRRSRCRRWLRWRGPVDGARTTMRNDTSKNCM